MRSPRAAGRGHLLLQFDQSPTPQTVAELRRRGVTVLHDVPENGLLVAVGRRTLLGDLGVRFAAPVQPDDKVSPLITRGHPSARAGFFIVEFHPDVDLNEARGLVLSSGVELRDHPDLSSHHVMIHTNDRAKVAALAGLDEVAYVFPASSDLEGGVPTRACIGALTTNGPAAQSIPVFGDGWDGPGLGSATLTYFYSAVTAQLPAGAPQSEIQRAMAEWAKAVKITWQGGTSPTGPKTVNILFGSFSHGDPYPFDGPGGVLAHTFYPSPPNSEPLAGDMHFDDSETWRIGANIDLFSVALHELGHALGLGHSDDPNAVMYPYYRLTNVLSPLDISAIQTLYAAQNGAPPPPPTPLTLAVNVPASTTTAATMGLGGSVSGGQGAVGVTWATNHGTSGTAQMSGSAWTIAGIPLVTGSNSITVTANDSASHVAQTLSVTRQAAPPPPPPPPPTPTPTPTPTPKDTTPPSLKITSSTVISTSATSITLKGSASDNVGVVSVKWSTNTGGSGTATGTTQWTATVPLLVGYNMLTVRAYDAAGNSGWRTVFVRRR